MKPYKTFNKIIISILCTVCALPAWAQFTPLKYGNMDQWVTRNLKESRLLGGEKRQAFEIAPTAIDNSGKAYCNRGGSPWATSNVLASPAGVTKISNAVYPEDRPGHGKCARLETKLEHCKVLGIVNMEVLVAGSMFLGEMMEPVKSTSNPYSKFEMGVPLTRRPKALRFDYKVHMPQGNTRTYSNGFGKQRTLSGHDVPEALIILQRRWEDADGNIYAHRVGTGWERFGNTGNWVNGHDMTVHYGDITKTPYYKSYMGLRDGNQAYYARNSRGKMVKVHEVGWDSADAQPTHLMVMFSAGSGEPYTGTVGLTLWVDNVGLVY